MMKYKLSVVLLFCAVFLSANVKKESRHFLTTEAGIGYSSFLNSSDLGKSSGLVGGKVQVGYEWNYRHFILHTGLEFSLISDQIKATPNPGEVPYTQGLIGAPMSMHYAFPSYTVKPLMGQVNIPVQVGAVFQNRYYFLAGARIGLPVIHTASTSAQLHTYLTDPTLIGELNNVPVHDAYTSSESASHTWSASMINAQLSAEFGLILNSFWEKPEPKTKGRQSRNASSMRGRSKGGKKPILYRVAVFADYGITSAIQSPAQPVPLATVESTPQNARQVTLNDYFASQTGKANSLLVGAKFAILFQLNEQKPAKPVPSYFDIYIADANTSKPIPASLEIYDHAKKRAQTREARNGRTRYRAKIGEYTITASNAQYYPEKQTVTMDEEGITDTLRFALQPLPAPVVIDTPIIEVPIKVGTKVVLHNLFFATNKTYILPESEDALNDLAAFLTKHSTVAIRITGHTDAVGSEEANQRLSEGRANAVRDELIKRGIDPTRIEAEGKGENEPIADNATEEGRAKNRRVEFTIISTGDEDIEQIKE